MSETKKVGLQKRKVAIITGVTGQVSYLPYSHTDVISLDLFVFNVPPTAKVNKWERSGSVVECLTRDQGAAGFVASPASLRCGP